MGIWGKGETKHFYQLTPHQILNAIENIGLKPTGRCLPLNSLENRVYEIELDDGDSIIGKFYRPGRWTPEQLNEELSFIQELHLAELPVVPPISLKGKLLHQCVDTSIYFAIFPKRGGRLKDELSSDEVSLLGRTIARLHTVGQSTKSQHRLTLNIENFGKSSLKIIQDDTLLVPISIKSYLTQNIQDILQVIESKYPVVELQRIHGDLHVGNILWRDQTPLIVDFDDFLMGPVVQDLWTLFPGDDHEAIERKNLFIENYAIMKDFPYEQLTLIPYLRVLRQIHFNAWICKRWSDPAFQQTFSHCEQEQYWEAQYIDMRNYLNTLTQPQY